MALRGLAYRVRMAAYNAAGERVSGLASTITATLWADGVVTTITSGITELVTTGVYIIPLTAEQMTAYNLCVTAVSSTAGVTFDPVYLDTDAGRVDTSISSRLATSGYTTPPTVSEIAESVWTRSSRLITGGAPTANSIASAVWLNTERTITSLPETAFPTVAAIQNGLAKSNEIPTTSEIANAVGSVDLTALPNAAVGSLKTLALFQTNAKIVGEKLEAYETDGTIHAEYDVISTKDGVSPIIGIVKGG